MPRQARDKHKETLGKERCFIAQGDAVVALYHVPHNATRNENPSGSPRYQLYFRGTNARRSAAGAEGAEGALQDLWSDWDGLAADLPKLEVRALCCRCSPHRLALAFYSSCSHIILACCFCCMMCQVKVLTNESLLLDGWCT